MLLECEQTNYGRFFLSGFGLCEVLVGNWIYFYPFTAKLHLRCKTHQLGSFKLIKKIPKKSFKKSLFIWSPVPSPVTRRLSLDRHPRPPYFLEPECWAQVLGISASTDTPVHRTFWGPGAEPECWVQVLGVSASTDTPVHRTFPPPSLRTIYWLFDKNQTTTFSQLLFN